MPLSAIFSSSIDFRSAPPHPYGMHTLLLLATLLTLSYYTANAICLTGKE